MTKSQGAKKDGVRFITVFKQKTRAPTLHHKVDLSESAQQLLQTLTPPTLPARQLLAKLSASGHGATPQSHRSGRMWPAGVSLQVPNLPPQPKQHLQAFRRSLPAFAARSDLLTVISQNQVTLVSGETGCGKTTQVPQFLLEDAVAQNQNCRIICTQPRRLAAIGVADRVAAEVGDSRVGGTVGYNIHLGTHTKVALYGAATDFSRPEKKG